MSVWQSPSSSVITIQKREKKLSSHRLQGGLYLSHNSSSSSHSLLTTEFSFQNHSQPELELELELSLEDNVQTLPRRERQKPKSMIFSGPNPIQTSVRRITRSNSDLRISGKFRKTISPFFPTPPLTFPEDIFSPLIRTVTINVTEQNKQNSITSNILCRPRPRRGSESAIHPKIINFLQSTFLSYHQTSDNS
jgi:hypothetical protein